MYFYLSIITKVKNLLDCIKRYEKKYVFCFLEIVKTFLCISPYLPILSLKSAYLISVSQFGIYIPHCEIYIPHCGFCIPQCETENLLQYFSFCVSGNGGILTGSLLFSESQF